jgi:hypothetical protein
VAIIEADKVIRGLLFVALDAATGLGREGTNITFYLDLETGFARLEYDWVH